MKILHLPLWIPTKADIQLGNFIHQQIQVTEIDHEIYTLSFLSSSNSSKIEFVFNSKNSLTVFYPKFSNKALTFLYFLLASKKATTYIKREHKFDLIHCHVAGRNLWIAKTFFKTIPVVLSEHWSGFINGNFDKYSNFKKSILLNYINSCDAVVSVSEFLSEGLKRAGVKKSIKTIGNIIDVKEKKSSNDKSEVHFLVVADLVDQIKNISGVIRAIAKIKLEDKIVSLSIVGDGTDKNKLAQLVNDLNLSHKIKFLGRLSQEQVQEEILKTDCTIVNSNFETFSMVVLETIFTGNPVICTKCGAPEQFINENNGILIEKGNTVALTEAIEYFALNCRNFNPEEVRNSLKNNYRKEVIQEKLNKLYSSI